MDDLSRLRDLIDTSANPAAAAAAAAAATSAAADMDTAAATGATATTVAVPHALTAVQAVQQRAWLLHWSLFIHFQHPRGLDHLLDLALQPHYLNAIQTMAPHLLRYVVAAVVVNKRRRGAVKEVARVVGMEAYEYLDPVVAFVHCLWNEFDYDGAQRYLSECAEVCIL